MRSSLKDIAERLNVSIATVSWTLSGQGDKRRIGREVQKRILAYAEEINYRPNYIAKGLQTGQTGVLGLIVPDITDSFYSSIARQMEIDAEERGYSLMICSSEASQDREDRLLSTFRSRQIDGIVIASVEMSDSRIKESFEESFPIVTFDRLLPNTSYNSIMIDNVEASRHVVASMIACGARRIAFITTNSHLQEMKDRRRGYEKALREAGIEPNESLIGDICFQKKEQETFSVLDAMLQHCPDVDGFFFATHVLAVESFYYFHERGININSGYQLGCIHSEKTLKAFAPQMKVTHLPVEDISREAIRIVVECIQCFHKGEYRTPEHLILECVEENNEKRQSPPSP